MSGSCLSDLHSPFREAGRWYRMSGNPGEGTIQLGWLISPMVDL